MHVAIKNLGAGRRFSSLAPRGGLRDRNGKSKSRHFACAAQCLQNIAATELTGAVMGSDDWQERASQSSANALKDAIAKSEAANVGFETLSRAGQPAEAIAQVARDKGIEHIVMGTRGLGRIQGLLMGSVAMKVIHLAQVPITLIK